VDPGLDVEIEPVVQDGALTIPIKAGINKPGHVQLFQEVPVQKAERYRLSFEARREGEAKTAAVSCSQLRRPRSPLGLWKDVVFEEICSAHSFTFTARSTTEDNPAAIRLMRGHHTGPVHLHNFSLVEVAPEPARSSRSELFKPDECDRGAAPEAADRMALIWKRRSQ
jgi:hypothetical protein